MKIAIIGAGAIGSVVAAYLTKTGEDVVLTGREDQVEAISKNGLHITGFRGEETIQLNIKIKIDEAPDLVIFTVKTQDLEEAYQQNYEMIEDALILSTQNGVQADTILSSHFARDKMLSSIVMFGATYVKPGEITFNFEGDWIIGRPYLPVSPIVHEVAEILKKAFSVVVSENITGMKYLKLFVNFNNCIPALIGKSMQETFEDMDLCRLSIMLLKEGVDIVQATKTELISLPTFPKEKILGLVDMPIDQAAGIINQTLTKLSKEPLYGSILQSILRKRPSEIDFIYGEVIHMAKQIHMESPLNSRVVDLIHKIESHGEYLSLEEVKSEFNLT